jgi:hypothetical protein
MFVACKWNISVAVIFIYSLIVLKPSDFIHLALTWHGEKGEIMAYEERPTKSIIRDHF